jgi:Cytochrome c3/Cytochrome c7 and related cytochrome c
VTSRPALARHPLSVVGALVITWRGLFLVSLAAAGLTVPQVLLAQPTAPSNDDCLGCHGDSSAVRADGRPVAVAADAFAGSVHGALGLSCVSCHTDLATLTEYPHADKLKPPDCSTCHEATVTQFMASAHAAARKGGNAKAASCADCHGMHDIKPASDPASRTNHFNVAATCGACHGPSGARSGAPAVLARFEDSIHGQALARQGLVVAPNCASCHGAHEISAKSDPASRVHRGSIVETCTKCHAGIRPAYDSGVHAQAVRAGNTRAPVCADCHTAHDIGSVATDRWQLAIIRECGTCHAQSLRTYRDTFHGKVTELGFTRVAKCADCHGAHGILPASNPMSMVSPERRLATCRQCHPTANANFAQYDPHADPHDPKRNPGLHYATLFMKGLLGCVFVFFGIHTMLWFPRSLQARRDRGRQPEGDADGDREGGTSGQES